MKTENFDLRVVSEDAIHTDSYIRDIVSQLEEIEGVESAALRRESERDISEIERIISQIGDDDLEQLQAAIEQYTEG